MINILEDHNTVSILEKLMYFRLEFGVYPNNCDSRTPQCPDAVTIDKLVHFQLEPQFDKPMLNDDCGSDVLARAEKRRAW